MREPLCYLNTRRRVRLHISSYIALALLLAHALCAMALHDNLLFLACVRRPAHRVFLTVYPRCGFLRSRLFPRGRVPMSAKKLINPFGPCHLLHTGTSSYAGCWRVRIEWYETYVGDLCRTPLTFRQWPCLTFPRAFSHHARREFCFVNLPLASRSSIFLREVGRAGTRRAR